MRHSKPVPEGEVPATYGIPQKETEDEEFEEPLLAQKTLDGEEVHIEDDEIKHIEPEHPEETLPPPNNEDEAVDQPPAPSVSSEQSIEEASETKVPQENPSAS